MSSLPTQLERLAVSLCSVFLLAILLAVGTPLSAGAQTGGEPDMVRESPETRYARERRTMVQVIVYLVAGTSSETGIAEVNQHVLRAMNTIPRHLFVPAWLRSYAYCTEASPRPTQRGAPSIQFIRGLNCGEQNYSPNRSKEKPRRSGAS